MNERSFLSQLAAMAGDIKLSHTLFAMPFAILGMVLASVPITLEQTLWQSAAMGLGLVMVCMFFARSFAMLANRYVDRTIDAANPRTAQRALVSGQVGVRSVRYTMIACAIGLIITAAGFGLIWHNWWPVICSPVVLAWLGSYGLMKRYTALCHLFLGVALGMSPVAAVLAINPELLAEATIWWLAGFVVLWVAGFDVIYAVQDIDVDRSLKLHSIPAKFGQTGALTIAKVMHVGAMGLLILVDRSHPVLGPWFQYGVIAVGALLIVEHHVARRGKLAMAFFTFNGVISLVLCGCGVIDLLR